MELVIWNYNAIGLYLGGRRFVSRPVHWLPWGFSSFTSVSPGECRPK